MLYYFRPKEVSMFIFLILFYMKKIIIAVGVVVLVPVIYWLVSPLFIDSKSSESLEDLLSGAELVETGGESGKKNDVVIKEESNIVLKENLKVESKVILESEPVVVVPEPVVEQPLVVEEKNKATIIGEGIFQGLASHSAEGKALLIKLDGKYFVRFEDNFKVTNGPDLFVDFGNNGVHDGSARLGALKGSSGGQNYEVPASFDINNYNEVWVWCRAFSVPFAKVSFK